MRKNFRKVFKLRSALYHNGISSLNRQQKLLVYSLGLLHSSIYGRFKDKPYSAVISKSAFVEMAMNSNIAKIKERALYKNFEALEKQKYVSYINKSLVLSKKGQKVFNKVLKEVVPYLDVHGTFSSEQNMLKFTQKAKGVLTFS